MTERTTAAGRRLLEELSESPLPGARYAHAIVKGRLPEIIAEAKHGEAELLLKVADLRAAPYCPECGGGWPQHLSTCPQDASRVALRWLRSPEGQARLAGAFGRVWGELETFGDPEDFAAAIVAALEKKT